MLATLAVPITESDSRYEPVVLVGVAVALVAAPSLLGWRAMLGAVAAAILLAGALPPPLTVWTGHLAQAQVGIAVAVAGLGVVVLAWGGQPFVVALMVTALCARAVGSDAHGGMALVVILGATLLWAAALCRGGLRPALIAGRGGERAAAVRGVDVAGARQRAWLIAVVLAGAAGCGLGIARGASAPGTRGPGQLADPARPRRSPRWRPDLVGADRRGDLGAGLHRRGRSSRTTDAVRARRWDIAGERTGGP